MDKHKFINMDGIIHNFKMNNGEAEEAGGGGRKG
jgi:hypothetical protein